jgi:hypothetical protein
MDKSRTSDWNLDSSHDPEDSFQRAPQTVAELRLPSLIRP